ncbi:hypothetical protein, partial [Flavobacterium sasangense]|uniref:hypothetical protein n=1 Tax=Flavobacterium sasangense TaxID=503361 RepID=UPI0005582065
MINRLVLLFFFLSYNVKSQDMLWEKSFGGKHCEILTDILSTSDNGFVLAGSSISGKTGNKSNKNIGSYDYWICKIDFKGELEWQKSFGGEGSDMLTSIIQTEDGGFLLGGTSSSNKSLDKKEDSKGQSDFWIIKLNSSGIEEWQKTFGGEWHDELQSVITGVDGGFLLGGTSASGISSDKTTLNYGNLDYWIIKINPLGEII